MLYSTVKNWQTASAVIVVSLVSGCTAGGGVPATKPDTAPKASVPTQTAPANTATPVIKQASSTAPVSTTAAASAAPNAAAAAPAQTPEEHRAALEHKLDESLGSFDRELSSERERVARERDTRTAQSGSAVTEGPTEETEHEGRHGRARAPGTRPGDLHSDRAAREAKGATDGNNTNSSNKNGAVGRNIPDGSDDDIVARRLRKAAEQETDPELKERLWQEYIEYKQSGQNKS